MTDQEIRDLFNENLDMTLDRLAKITGKSREQLRRILMGTYPYAIRVKGN
jgi:hypothetical protein